MKYEASVVALGLRLTVPGTGPDVHLFRASGCRIGIAVCVKTRC